jgi:hypothetical protein
MKGRENAFLKVVERFRPGLHKDISIVQFYREDIVRHPLIQWIDERLTGSVADPEFANAACPSCSTIFRYEYEAEKNNDIVRCFACDKLVELLDENGKLDPMVIGANDGSRIYASRGI